MQVTIKPIHHQGVELLAIIFPFDKTIDYAVRSIKGIKWTQTHKCWYLPLSKGSFEVILEKLKGKANVEYSALKEFLQKRKQVMRLNLKLLQRADRSVESRHR